MSMRRLSPFPIVFLVMIMVFSGPGNGVYPGEEILDASLDVLSYSIAEREVQGYGDIDILSLETFDRVYSVDAYLTVRGEVRDDLGYIYSMSVGGVSVIYDNGTVQGMTSEGDPLDVDAEIVSGNQIHAQIRKTWMDEGDPVLNASAQLFFLDYNGERRFENYYDVVEGDGVVSPVSRYQVSLTDGRNDVRFSFLESARAELPEIDIASLEVSRSGGDVRMEMRIPGGASPDAVYTFHLGDESFVMREGRLSGEGSGPLSDQGVEGEVVFIEFRGDILPGGTAYCEARMERQDGGWFEDVCPDEPLLFLDIFPFSCGSRVDMELRIDDDLSGEFRVTTSDLPEGITDAMDGDSSGDLSAEEVDSVFADVVLGLEEAVRSDGSSVVEDVSVTAGDDSFTVIMSLALDTLSSIEIVPMRELVGGSGPDVELSFTVSLPEGYSVIPDTLRPEGLSNYLTDGSGSISMTSREIGDLSLMANGVSFTVREKTDTTGNEKVSYEDVPAWAYVLGVLFLAGAAVLVYRIARGRKELPPPGEDY